MQWANFFEITVSLPPFFIKVVDPPPISHEGGCHSPIFHESDWPFTIFHERGWPSPIFKESCWPPILCTPPLGVFLAASLICLDVQACKTFITMNTDLQNWSSAATTTKKIIHETSNILKKVTVTHRHTEIVKCRIAVYVVDGDWKCCNF